MKKRWQVLTIFPELFGPFTELGVVRRAFSEQVEFTAHQMRDWLAEGETIDDRPFGGGPGMVMRHEPIVAAAKSLGPAHVVKLCPQGKKFAAVDAKRLAEKDSVLFICGRYEGIDERVSSIVDEEFSIGDVVLTGGELPAMVMMDAMSRFLPGVVGTQASVVEDSFNTARLDCPHYTRPATNEVPDVLLSGDHKRIAEWRMAQRAKRTLERRKDLIALEPLTEQEQKVLKDYCEEKV